jgi:hypothetical protein
MKRKKETPEQVSERMAKLRAKRKPAQYKNIHSSVLAKPDDDVYSFKNVKEWIKESKELVSSYNKSARGRGISPQEKQKASNAADNKRAYIRYCEHYLKHGDWISDRSGKQEEHRVIPKCVAMAYNSDGTPKRNIGVYYPDIEAVWTKEMDELGYKGEDGTMGYGNAPVRVYKNKLKAMTDKQFTGQ